MSDEAFCAPVFVQIWTGYCNVYAQLTYRFRSHDVDEDYKNTSERESKNF